MAKEEMLRIAEELARSAGSLIRKKLGGCFTTGYKSCPADLVTEVDKQSQAIILDGLQKHFPSHCLVAEEKENSVFSPGDRATWYVDPLDGTTNFVFGLPFCAVSIALTENESAVLGVVYDPLRDEMFTAVRGSGTMLNGSPVKVDRSRNTLEQSLLVTGFPVNPKNKELMAAARMKDVIFKSLNLRALGSAALELAYVACGRLTGFWEVTLRPWDVAAGAILVKESGGEVSGIMGEPLKLSEYVSIVASNGAIHRDLLDTLGYKNFPL